MLPAFGFVYKLQNQPEFSSSQSQQDQSQLPHMDLESAKKYWDRLMDYYSYDAHQNPQTNTQSRPLPRLCFGEECETNPYVTYMFHGMTTEDRYLGLN